MTFVVPPTIGNPKQEQKPPDQAIIIANLEYLLTRDAIDGRHQVIQGIKASGFKGPVMIKIYSEGMGSNAVKEGGVLKDLHAYSESNMYIVRCFDFAEDVIFNGNKRCALVMERGKKNLKKLVEDNAPKVLQDNVIPTMRQIAECLHFLHVEARMVHGDLKLENVVNFGGDFVELKLIDFENCCRMGEPMSMECTPEYCPPELAQQQPSLTASASFDVWCFGVLWMKYLLRGCPLVEFQGDNACDCILQHEILHRVAQPKFNFEKTLKQLKVSTPVKQLIRSCTARVPADRPTIQAILTSEVLRGVSTTLFSVRQVINRLRLKRFNCFKKRIVLNSLSKNQPPQPQFCGPTLVRGESSDSSGMQSSSPTCGNQTSDPNQQWPPEHIISIEGREYLFDQCSIHACHAVMRGTTVGSFNRHVMIKVYKSGMDSCGVKEANTIQALYRHPSSMEYIVNCIDFSSSAIYKGEKHTVLVMESGKANLKQTVADRMPMADVVPTMRKIAQCLCFFHSEAQMVHGRVILENVVNFGMHLPDYKLLDFENCCAMNEPMPIDGVNVECCPPELAARIVDAAPGALIASHAFDVWCFGVLWMKILLFGRGLVEFEGRIPGEMADQSEILQRIAQPEFNFEKTLQQLKVSTPVKQLICRCTARDPATRPTMETVLGSDVLRELPQREMITLR